MFALPQDGRVNGLREEFRTPLRRDHWHNFLFFNSAGMQTLHFRKSGMFQYPVVFDSICSLFLRACWRLLGPAPVLAPGQQAGAIPKAWLCCALWQAFEMGELLWTPTGLGVTAGQRPESNSQMSWDAEWSGLAPVLPRIHFTAASFHLTTRPSEFHESHVLWMSPGMQINYFW